jgi:hypothetical protein
MLSFSYGVPGASRFDRPIRRAQGQRIWLRFNTPVMNPLLLRIQGASSTDSGSPACPGLICCTPLAWRNRAAEWVGWRFVKKQRERGGYLAPLALRQHCSCTQAGARGSLWPRLAYPGPLALSSLGRFKLYGGRYRTVTRWLARPTGPWLQFRASVPGSCWRRRWRIARGGNSGRSGR